jgi:trans-2,3-dihydro-3-hydroxyanthranilate isomerase
MARSQATVVDVCIRDGQGGCPTTVVIDDATLTDDER